MTDFEKQVLTKLDIIIAQTAPKKKRQEKPTTQEASEVLALFNKYFNKSVTMTKANAKCISARLKELKEIVKQADEKRTPVQIIEDWFIYASTDKWWIDRPNTAKITTHLNDKFVDRLEGMGTFKVESGDLSDDDLMM